MREKMYSTLIILPCNIDTVLYPIFLTVLGLGAIFLIINKYKLQSRLKASNSLKRDKPVVNLVYHTLSHNTVFLYDKNDKQGLFLGLFGNGSIKGFQMYNINPGKSYWGYVVRLDCITAGGIHIAPHPYFQKHAVWYKITNVDWELIQTHVYVVSNNIPVKASVIDHESCEVKIYTSEW